MTGRRTAPGAGGPLVADPGEFGGAHCETAALRKQLLTHGVDISEPLLLGLGGGIGFWYQPAAPGGPSRSMTSTRNGPFPVFTTRMCRALGLELTVHRTDDPATARRRLHEELAAGRPVIAYVDLFHLPWFQASRHFGGHAVVVFATDEETGTTWLSDRCPGPLAVDATTLATARASGHHPFPPSHAWLSADWAAARLPDADGFRRAVHRCAQALTRPAPPNEGLAGLAAFAAELTRDIRTAPADRVVDRLTAAHIDFEYAGTGGRGFRDLYRQFLTEARPWLDGPALTDALAAADDARAAWAALDDLLVPDTGPAGRELRATYRRRERYLRRGTTDSLRRAAGHTARLPELRAAAADEVGPHRDRLAEETGAAFRHLLRTEHTLARALLRV
ncbi:BtrH N-terminal domain-containing protein [Streptomyces spiramenti]|uniref:BtrH N-terminal domain-containing protein n=1 Tax=Streptomyces spiramenti TaxID=2720606 RepID=A0ABX1AJW7_9ACTN|nr:BtrH N-terminal domain-containing protein [Streptomyces spiramenti]NJP67419.1 BtrH N-terminal domain-containing protein [Streptomyces spiramenti]